MRVYDVRNEPNTKDHKSKVYSFGGFQVKVNRRVRDYNWFNVIRGGRNYVTTTPKSWTRQTGFGRVVEFGKLALTFKRV